jgi:hypothetical protein
MKPNRTEMNPTAARPEWDFSEIGRSPHPIAYLACCWEYWREGARQAGKEVLPPWLHYPKGKRPGLDGNPSRGIPPLEPFRLVPDDYVERPEYAEVVVRLAVNLTRRDEDIVSSFKAFLAGLRRPGSSFEKRGREQDAYTSMLWDLAIYRLHHVFGARWRESVALLGSTDLPKRRGKLFNPQDGQRDFADAIRRARRKVEAHAKNFRKNDIQLMVMRRMIWGSKE